MNVNSTKGEEEAEAGIRENPSARDAFRRLQLQDENGEIPPDALIDAYKQKEDMPFLPQAWGEFMQSSVPALQGSKPGDLKESEPGVLQASEEETPDIPNPWVSIGPGNIGGRIRSIIIHPTAVPRTIWVGAVSGGVWKSTDDGMTWRTTTDFLANLGVHCMAIDPANPDVLYAGTGEAFRGNGIFKTTDGGNTWTRLNATANNPDFHWVYRLAVSPGNSQILLAATATSSPYDHGSGKIFRSTDGGVTWSPTLSLTDTQMADVRFKPAITLSEVPEAVITCLACSYQGRVYYSTDDGVTWAAASGLPPSIFRVELAYSRSNTSIVYASASERLYRSNNGGSSFASTGSSPPPLPGTNPWANALWVDPTAQANSNTVIAGGIYLSRTTDGGANWGGSVNTGIHLDHHVIVEDPGYNGTSNQIVYGSNDGGIHKTTNVLATSITWANLNNNLGVTQFYGAAGHVATDRIIGGTQDNGSLLSPVSGSQIWTTIFGNDIGGDGGFCAVDQSPVVERPFFYGEFTHLQIWRSTNGAQTKHYIFNGPNGIPRLCEFGYGPEPCANFIAPFVLDPNDRNTILAGGKSLWRTNDARNEAALPSWLEIKSPTPPNCAITNTCTYINAIAVADGFADLIWVGHNDGSVAYTTQGTAPSPIPSWTAADPNHMLPQGRLCTRVTIGQAPETSGPQIAVPRTVYVTFGGFPSAQSARKGNVWKTQDDGVTWTDITGTLPRAPIYSLVISPSNPNALYVGTEVGVFATSDGGTTWSPGNGGPANVPVLELFWMGPKLVAATHGRGIFALTPP